MEGQVPAASNQNQVELLAPPQPISTRPQINQSKMTPTTQTTSESPLSFILRDKEAREKDREVNEKLAQKYSSIDSKNKAGKIEALKNVNLNPYRLNDPYDGLANSLHRWKSVAADADSKIKSGEWDWRKGQELKDKIAENYYNSMIAPLAAATGSSLSKEEWMKQAYKEALNYNIEDAYNNSIIHGLKHGWNEGLPALARAGEYVFDTFRKLTASPVGHTDEEYSPWFKRTQSAENILKPSIVNTGSQKIQENHQFYADSLPNHNWIEKSTSFISEQAAQLPIFAAMSLGAAPLGETNLTKQLLSSPVGKKVFSYLMAGTEGLAYGKLTRPQEDKNQAWRDAAGFLIFHGMFDVGGLGLKKLGDLTDKFKGKEERLALAQEGLRPANAVETYAQHKAEVGNNLAVAGVQKQREIFADALHYIHDMDGRGWSKEQIKDHELALLNKDPARFAPMLSSAKYIRSLLGAIGKPIGAIEKGSEDEKFLSSRLAKLIVDAGSEMNTNVKGMQEEIEKNAEAQIKEPAAKHTLDFYRAKVSAEIAKDNPTVLKMMKPEELDKLAAKRMAKDQEKAAAIAEKKLAENPSQEAENIAKRRREESVPLIKEQTKRTTDKYGQPAVSYSFKPDYKVALKNYMKQAKEKNISLSKFFEDMSDEDFKADLTTHFYPRALHDAGVFFEHQNSREGKQDPNFLGFMYNYIDQMPREFGKELENRLIDTMKVQKFMNGRKPTEPQLMYFAKAMYNHVDNFLASGRWPKESNIFRSTQDTMWQSTKWQKQLLREKMIEEQKNLKEMFAGNPRAKKAALTAYNAFAKKRLEEYEIGPKDLESQARIQKLDLEISDILTSTGERERIPF